MKLAFTSGFAGHVVNDVIRRRIMETVGYGRKREAGRNVGYYVSSCIGFVRLVCGNVWGYFRVGGVHSKQIKLRDGVAYCFSLLSSSSSSLPPSPSFFLVVIKIHVDGPSSDHAVTRGKPPPPKKRVLPPAIHHGRECELRATFFPSRVGSDKRTRDCAPLVIVLLRLYGFVVVVISSCWIIHILYLLFSFSVFTGDGQQQQQYFAERPQNTSVREGQMAVLRCRVGNQQGRAQWTKDGFALGKSKRSICFGHLPIDIVRSGSISCQCAGSFPSIPTTDSDPSRCYVSS